MKNLYILLIALFIFSGCEHDFIKDDKDDKKTTINLTDISVNIDNGTTFEKGRTISTTVKINSDILVSDEISLFYTLVDSNSNQVSIESYQVTLQVGENTIPYDVILPLDMSSGDDYRLKVYLDYNNYFDLDSSSIKEILDESVLSIIDNDGNADVEVNSMTLSEQTQALAVEADTKTTYGVVRATTTEDGEEVLTSMDDDIVDANEGEDGEILIEEIETSSPLITFDIAYNGDDVIVNQPHVRFDGTVNVSTLLANSNDTTMSACITIGSECEPIEFFGEDENGESYLTPNFKLGELNASEQTNAVVMFNISKEVLKKIAIYTFTNNQNIYETKLTVNVNESSSSSGEDSSKNSTSYDIRFEPIELAEIEIDDVNDAVGQGENSTGMVLTKIKSDDFASDPSTYLDKADELIVDPQDYNWHDNIAVKQTRLSLPDKYESVKDKKIDLGWMGSYWTYKDVQTKAWKTYQNRIYKRYSKSFEKSKYGSKFGGSVNAGSEFVILKSGAFFNLTKTKVKVKVMGKKFTIADITHNVEERDQKEKEKYTTKNGSFYQVKSLGKVLTKKTKTRSADATMTWTKDFHVEKYKKREKKIDLGVTDFNVKGKVGGQLGIELEAKLSKTNVSVTAGPFVLVDAKSSASIGGSTAGAKFTANARIIKNTLPIGLDMPYEYSATKVTFKPKFIIDNVLKLPNGKVKLKWWIPFYSGTKTLFSFSCGTREINLYTKELNKKTMTIEY